MDLSRQMDHACSRRMERENTTDQTLRQPFDMALRRAVQEAMKMVRGAAWEAGNGRTRWNLAAAGGRTTQSTNRGGEDARGMHIEVANNNVEQAMKKLKRKMIQEGVLKELRAKEQYLRPSKIRVLKENEQKRRQLRREFKKRLDFVLKKQSRGF